MTEGRRCDGVLQPLPTIYKKLMVDNLTVVRPPMLKIFYWESFQIGELNKKLRSNKQEHEHDIVIPMRQIHSQPFKMIIWLKNLSAQPLTINLKRIQNCGCLPQMTRVGFNQFRQLFHCPHRRLIHLKEDLLCIQPDEILPLSAIVHFFLYGDHVLSYEVKTDDDRKFIWHFKMQVSEFDPSKCLLTKELIPVNIRNFPRVIQPIWVQNITMDHLNFSFSSNTRGLKLNNSTLTVPRQSIWPLMVEYRPVDFENDIELAMSFDTTKVMYNVKAKGVLIEEDEDTGMPLNEQDCVDFLYVIYPNQLSITAFLNEERTRLVNVHNYGQECMEFHWQNYIISEYFAITFNPQIFRLKGHHSKLCQIKICVFQRLLNFRRVPIVLEVHRIQDLSVKIAKAELSEIESIDDPKWKEDSYLEHVFLHFNIRARDKLDENDNDVDNEGKLKSYCMGYSVNDNKMPPKDIEKPPAQIRSELIDELSTKRKLTTNELIDISMAIDQRITIFEKLFWGHLSKSNFMRIQQDLQQNKSSMSYDQMLSSMGNFHISETKPQLERNTILDILSQVVFEATQDLSKNWSFIPPQYYERPL